MARSGLTALYIERDVGFVTARGVNLSPKSYSKSLGDKHTAPGRRGRAFWSWIEENETFLQPAAYVIWSRVCEDSAVAGYEQLGLSFVAEMWADEVGVPIIRGDENIVRSVLGANYPHTSPGIQAWAREHGHDRSNQLACNAALLWHWGRARFGKLVL